jgi:hypothetical protein
MLLSETLTVFVGKMRVGKGDTNMVVLYTSGPLAGNCSASPLPQRLRRCRHRPARRAFGPRAAGVG